MHVRPIVQRVIRKYWFSKREARYHFIHIPKNAGISVRDALTLQRDVSLSTPYHYRYVDIADTVGRHLKFFAVVRNPWSRTASRFHYGRQNSQRWPVNDPRREYISKATFADFVRDQKILPIPEHPGQPWMGPVSSWFNQLEWIRDEAGVVAADCLRLEHLDDDLPVYLQRAIAPRRHNVTHTRYDYRSMYTVDLAEEVGRLFREDIDYFGFSFEGPATRNVFCTG